MYNRIPHRQHNLLCYDSRPVAFFYLVLLYPALYHIKILRNSKKIKKTILLYTSTLTSPSPSPIHSSPSHALKSGLESYNTGA